MGVTRGCVVVTGIAHAADARGTKERRQERGPGPRHDGGPRAPELTLELLYGVDERLRHGINRRKPRRVGGIVGVVGLLDREFRKRFQFWIGDLWMKKDARIAEMLGLPAPVYADRTAA